jgi:hypothetical protein
MKLLVVRITFLAFIFSGLSLPAQGGVLMTGDYFAATARADHMAAIDTVLSREDVRTQMVALGVDPDDALSRISEFPDEELAQLAGQMEELPAGGSVLAFIGAVFVVLLILELTGVINIFNKV